MSYKMDKSDALTIYKVMACFKERAALKAEVEELRELLRSAYVIADRKGAETAWDRFKASIANTGLNGTTARTYRILPDELNP